MSISSEDDTASTESDGNYDSELDSDVDMHMEDAVDAPDCVDSDSDVHMARDGDNGEEEAEEEEDEKKEDAKDKEQEENKDEDDCKEPRTIGKGVMVNTSYDYVDIMVDDVPIVLHEQGQEIRDHTARPQHPAPATRPLTPDPCPRPRTPETHALSRFQHLGLGMMQKPRPAVPTVREAESGGNTSDGDVDQPVLIESAGGDSLSDVPPPDVPLPDISLSPKILSFKHAWTVR